MGLLGRRDPRRVFDGPDFTVTSVLFEPPRLSLLPWVVEDSSRGLWAVRFPGCDPAVFRDSELLDCRIVERAPDVGDGGDRGLAARIMANPAAVSRANAAGKGRCLGLSVVLAVRSGEEGVARLEIPVITREVRRDSPAFESLSGYAGEIKGRMDVVIERGAAGPGGAESEGWAQG